ncbi:glycosyltransferase family 4 protein [Fuchsiella alkaliacetigena]|uniref:glycosyltransferase family 4 protein n=1 Tax=Fuchsiella alkaliacetigena TaxID=957042 RepID=UPI00200A7305|nr:MraY family glycosyltransferase [Fuchsiella alkaliacetigena]MCK8824590.1 undecaprenyl/decaprenyl-phosphate alpha-N-acetylglucosaminyl 1-phosphate transferase [Fuchsiella alkaliacetigena]
MEKYLFSFLIAASITYLITPFIKKLALYLGAVDTPNNRRINTVPIANLGGLAIYIGFLITLLMVGYNSKLLGILVCSTLMFFLGLVDDIKGVTAYKKFIFQLLIAGLLTQFGIKIEFITNPLGGMFYLGVLSIPFTIFWLVAITNTLNLIDGLDGLAAGVSIIAALTLFLVAMQEAQVIIMLITVIIAGVCFGFLQYNFNPAQIFMGDAGSLFLGFLFASISAVGALKGAATMTLVIPILALGVPIFDTAFAIIRRCRRKKPIFKADQGHIHHKLLDLGLTQVQAVLVVYLASIFLGLLAVLINGTIKLIVIFLAVLVLVILGVILYRLNLASLSLESNQEKYENVS